jgi:hypothetical protein
MAYTEASLHEKACEIWLALLQACPLRYQFQDGFSDAARPLSAFRRLQLLDEAFPDNRLEHDWVQCQKAIAYTENGLHGEACKTWIALLRKENERLVFKEGFLKAIRPLPTTQRLKLLQLVKNDEAVLWVDHAIAMEYYSREDYEKSYLSFTFLFKSQPIKALTDAKIPLIHSIVRGNRTLIKERLQQLPSTLKLAELGPESTILECCDSLLELGYIEESAELWIQCARNDRYHHSFLARLCKSLHLQLEAQDCLTIWRALVEANPNNPLLLAEFRIACATHLDDIVVLHTLQQLVARYPENPALFSMLVQHVKPAGALRRLAVCRGLTVELPQNRHFRNELYLARTLAGGGVSNYDTLCMICMENDIDTCFSRCGHVCCTKCAASMGRCHICRKTIRERIKIYAVVSHVL